MQVTTPDTIDRVLLVRSVEHRHKRDGSPFLRMTLADRSSTLDAVLWDADERAVRAVEQGAAVHVIGRVDEHPRYGRQLTVDALRRAGETEIDWDELVEGPIRPAAELERDLDTLISSVSEPHLAALLERVLGAGTDSGRRYRRVPAAKFNHHAYRCGLLEHSVGIAQLVSAAAAVFGGIDRDLGVTGALLHDIGKLEAYDGANGCSDLTDAGRLEGEIPLGYYRVRREIEAIAGFPHELARALLHVILAHHGCLEHGSPVAPGTREAALVHAIDELSGRLGAFDRLEKEMVPGERWSRYDRALGGCAFFAGT
jgi:3'-5' exoribonuclease